MRRCEIDLQQVAWCYVIVEDTAALAGPSEKTHLRSFRAPCRFPNSGHSFRSKTRARLRLPAVLWIIENGFHAGPATSRGLSIETAQPQEGVVELNRGIRLRRQATIGVETNATLADRAHERWLRKRGKQQHELVVT